MFKKLLAKIGASFKIHAIPYMIIGGQAVLLYGEPRFTKDIDITLGLSIEHINKILTILRKLSLKPIPEDIEFFVKQTMVLPALDEASGIRVDFIFSFTPYERGAIKRAKKLNILNQEVCFASPEDLIIHKIFSARPRDLEDVRTIMLKNSKIDIQYIKNWLKEFDALYKNKNFQKMFKKILKET